MVVHTGAVRASSRFSGARGTFNESGVPSDFFGNASGGIHARKAFSYAIDYGTFITESYSGEASHPATAIIPLLPQCCPSIEGYSFNLTRAAEELHQIPGLWDTGFTIQFLYSSGSLPGRDKPYTQIANAINSLNPKFHCNALGVGFNQYLSAFNNKQLPVFMLGWAADYPDPHNFAYAFYHSHGNIASKQDYNNSAMDALIDLGIRQSDSQERRATYALIQQLVIDDCPSAALATPIIRHFEQTWVCGWYYNSIYPYCNYAANLWKWYYTPHAQQDTVTNATANLLPYDVNYDGKVNMYDIGLTAASFGSIYGPPMSSRWVCRCDFNNDRKIDVKDVGRVATTFGKSSSVWTPS
jgi:peptide/nickel transport system substrate-binding protein